MSAAESEAQIDRIVQKFRELGSEDFAAYVIVALGVLGHHAPDVLAFILDRTDERIGGAS